MEEDDNSADTTTLYTVIARDKIHGLNVTVPEDAKNVIKPWDERDSTDKWVDSNVDDQMIIHVPFTQNVKVRSILLKPARGAICPQRLRIYANHPVGVDFDDAERITPNLDMSILEGEMTVTEYPLRVAAFSNVNSLTLFFSESIETDVSRVYFIGFKGETRTPKKEVNSKLDIPAANAADAPVKSVAEKATGAQTTIR